MRKISRNRIPWQSILGRFSAEESTCEICYNYTRLMLTLEVYMCSNFKVKPVAVGLTLTLQLRTEQ